MKYPEAVQHYEEALRRGPSSVNAEAYKLYSNLAACYTKLGAYPDGVKVCISSIARRLSFLWYLSKTPPHPDQAADKCIEQAPSFAKGYSRKGALQFFMKVGTDMVSWNGLWVAKS